MRRAAPKEDLGGGVEGGGRRPGQRGVVGGGGRMPSGRRTSGRREPGDEAPYIFRRLRRAHREGILNDREYEDWYEKFLIARAEKDCKFPDVLCLTEGSG